MLKVTYSLAHTFSLKVVDDSHLNARSYPYPLLSTIRGAILSSVIRLRGVAVAKEWFNFIKNAKILIQFPESYQIDQQKIRTAKNGFYKEEAYGEHVDTIIGMREYVHMPSIVFYIDESIPEIETLLNNINYIGKSCGIVGLYDMKKVDKLENVLVEWNEERYGDQYVYEMVDWNNNMDFESIYLYGKSSNSRSKYKRMTCFINEEILIK